jgi:hypothetical protein
MASTPVDLGRHEAWQAGRTDPVRDDLLHTGRVPDLDALRRLFPATTGDVALDQDVIRAAVARLATVPAVDTGHPLLDLSVKVGLAAIDATFQGDHPKYGVKQYGETRHDGFPPTIIAAVDALTAWGLNHRAAQLFRYWVLNFVRADGTMRYYGPAVSEYGQLLHTAARLHECAGPAEWWTESRAALTRLADYLQHLCAEAERNEDLIPGVPEADISDADPNNLSDATHSERNRFFHNSAWAARGLQRWAELLGAAGASSPAQDEALRRAAAGLARRTVAAIAARWPTDPADWWLPPQLEPCPRPATLTASTLGSYTNYRYWPELLASGILPEPLAQRVVDARLNGGGQFCGMTRFMERLDDWPLADYLRGLWQLGRRSDFLLSLYGHVAYHQAGGHLTAYEQVTLPPCREMCAPYCLPCQLVAARAARFLVA